MISRRLLRIKALQILYAFFKSDDRSISKYEKELFFSINKTYVLYHYLFLLIIEVNDYAEQKINQAKGRRVASEEDLNPNTRLLTNKVIKQLNNSNDFNRFVDANKLSWADTGLVKKIYESMKDSEYYEKYMSSEEESYAKDKKFIMDFIAHELADSDEIYQVLEEESIYWNDDAEYVVSIIASTVKSFRENMEEVKLMPLFKDDDDREFVKQLYRRTIMNNVDTTELIDKHTKNWDVERIAFVDIVIMELAISEIITFPSIPIKVSINEYIEISKYYSTDKSGNFINGVVDKVIDELKAEDKIHKIGRGLK